MDRSPESRTPPYSVAHGITTYSPPGEAPNAWTEHLRVPTMSVGTYCVPAGGTDDQLPHREDEIYVIVAGRATLLVEESRIEVAPGSAVFVAAGVAHRFVDIQEDLTVVVVFSPPYTGR